MRKAAFILLLGVLALLIPGTVLRTVFPQLVAPNLLAVLLVWVAFHEVSALGALLAFLLGLELDFCSGTLLGPWAGAYAAVFGLLVLSSKRIFIESPSVVFIAVFAAVLLSSGIYHVMLVLIYGAARLEVFGALTTALLEAGASAILAPILFHFVPRRSPPENGLYRHTLRG